MPFTPYHVGPALALGLPLRRLIHAPTFLLANVILDVEPLLVLIFHPAYPLHGYAHTFMAAIPIGLGIGYLMLALEGSLIPIYRVFLFESEARLGRASFLSAGVIGTVLHILLDSPLYDDILPFYPLKTNPMHDPSLALYVYMFSFWMGVFGLTYYMALIISKALRRRM